MNSHQPDEAVALDPRSIRPTSAPETLAERMRAKKTNHFDALRLFFATMVLAYHCQYALSPHATYRDPLMRLTSGGVGSGALAVGAFFAISGFLITKSWVRNPEASIFLRKRFLRIYPGYLAAVIVSALVFGFWVFDDRARYLELISSPGFLLSALFVRLDFPDEFMAVNGCLWSIGYEVWCYLAVLVLGLGGVFRRRGLMLGALAGSVTLLALQLWFDVELPGAKFHRLVGWPSSWPELMSYFLAGSVLYLSRDRVPYASRWVTAAGVVLGGTTTFWPTSLLPIVLPLAFSYLIVAFAYSNITLPSRRSGRIDLSYGIYLYGFPIQVVVGKYFGMHFNPVSLFLVLLPLVALAAYASWTFVEGPFLRRVDRPTA